MTSFQPDRLATSDPLSPRAAPASNTSAMRWLYATRGLVAVVWSAAFAATVSSSLTSRVATLLVLYPLIDVVASAIDSRLDHSAGERRFLMFSAGYSLLGAVSLAVAANGDVPDALRVFGVWAAGAGVAQVVVALRRRGPQTGGQWPMLVAGGLSALVGIFYVIEAAGDDPKLDKLIAYAGAGGVFFILQAAILAWRARRSPAREPSQ